jgi:hypothetical protein
MWKSLHVGRKKKSYIEGMKNLRSEYFLYPSLIVIGCLAEFGHLGWIDIQSEVAGWVAGAAFFVLSVGLLVMVVNNEGA